MIRLYFLVIATLIHFLSIAQIPKAPERKEGEGPWPLLILRGATLINGTGAPAIGPVDIVIENYTTHHQFGTGYCIIYDARKLLADVKNMVEADKNKNCTKILQPGTD